MDYFNQACIEIIEEVKKNDVKTQHQLNLIKLKILHKYKTQGKIKQIPKNADIYFAQDPYDAARDADAIMIVTEWNEFRELNLSELKKIMNKPVIIDGRNIYNPKMLESLGFTYQGIGRS